MKILFQKKIVNIVTAFLLSLLPVVAQEAETSSGAAPSTPDGPQKAAPLDLTAPAPQGAEDKYSAKTQQRYAAFSQTNPQVLFIGDSITQHWDNPESGLSVWDKNFKSFPAGNFGHRGDMTQNVIWRIEKVDWKGVNPKVIVLLIGTNNGDRGQRLFDGQKKIITMLNEHFPEAKIVFVNILPRDKGFAGKTQIFKTNEMASKLVAECKNVTILDMTQKFLGPDKQIKKELFTDGLHLSTAGYELWAAELLPVITPMLSKSAP